MQLERKLLIFTTAALSGLGLLMVYSSSITSRPSFADQKYLTRQLLFMVVGVAAATAASQMPVRFWRSAALPLFAATATLLVAVLIPGVGARINGAQRWFRFGSISIQPSELAKVALIVFSAWMIDRKGEAIRQFWKGWVPLLLLSLIMSGLVLVEPDFGTAVFLLMIAVIMLFLAGVPIRHMLVIAAGSVPIVSCLVLAQSYRVKRILEFLAGWSDPTGAPYQVKQSLVALGSGGLCGAGLGRGWQKLGFLPEANTDFVFAVIGEELGLLGTLAVLLLWGLFLACGVRLALRIASDRFAHLASLGLVCQCVLQALVNIGVVSGSLPPKGISLPFLSAGGSNLVVSLVSVGMVLGLTRREEDGGSRTECRVLTADY